MCRPVIAAPAPDPGVGIANEVKQTTDLYERGLYEEAATHAERVIDLGLQLNNSKYELLGHYWLGMAKVQQGDYPTAESELTRALSSLGPTSDPELSSYGDASLASMYFAHRQHYKAELAAIQALVADSGMLGQMSRTPAETQTIAKLYESVKAGSYEAFAQMNYIELSGPNAPNRDLVALAILEDSLGDHTKALTLLQAAALGAIASRSIPTMRLAVYDHASIEENLGDFDPGARELSAILTFDKKTSGDDSLAVVVDLNSLAVIKTSAGELGQADDFVKQALDIESNREDSLVGRLTSLNIRGAILLAKDDLRAAWKTFQLSLTTTGKGLVDDEAYKADAENGLAQIDIVQGRIIDGLKLLTDATKIYGAKHYEQQFIAALLLAVKTMPLSDADAALKMVSDADKLITQAHLQDQFQYIAVLTVLGSLYLEKGQFDDAQRSYEQAVRLYRLHPIYGPLGEEAKANLAYVLSEKGDYTTADQLIDEVLAKGNAWPSSPDTLTDASKIAAWVYSKQADRHAAESAFRRALALVEKQYAESLGWLSERDRLTYVGNYNYQAAYLFSYCERDPSSACAELMFDCLLWQRDMVASGIAAIQSKIATTQDPSVQNIYKELREKRSEISTLKLLEANGQTGLAQQIDLLERQSNSIEQAIVQKFPDLEGSTQRVTSWNDVRMVLAPNDAVVEYVRFAYNTGVSIYTNQGARYAALVLTHSSASPDVVDLGPADTVENDVWRDYLHSIAGEPSSNKMYEAVWKPIERDIAGANRVYVVPDGILTKTSFAAIVDTNRTPLIEKYDLRVLSNSGDLTKTSSVSPAVKPTLTADLFGDPAFASPSNEPPVSPQRYAELRDLNAITVNLKPAPLPGTAREVERISSILQTNGWSVRTFTGPLATKAAVESISGPRLLHIATHGFFISESEARVMSKNMPSWYADDVLLRSGLLFAGSGATDESASAASDILTAFEASGLNLLHTELVVLSACDTGLGDTENGEGVLGLRRALHEAGAQTIMMSLWSVPDRETEELMTAFYSKWLGGMEMHTALKAAQLELRSIVIARYGKDIPQYWAGFVLSD